MRKNLIFCCIYLSLFLLAFPLPITAQTCNAGYTGGSQVAGCGVCGSGAGYCCNKGAPYQDGCTCDSGSCSCSITAIECYTVSQATTCSCWITGGSCGISGG